MRVFTITSDSALASLKNWKGFPAFIDAYQCTPHAAREVIDVSEPGMSDDALVDALVGALVGATPDLTRGKFFFDANIPLWKIAHLPKFEDSQTGFPAITIWCD